ncbi:MAG: CDP-alcohol phosphatidyltransferase family protein [Candidatus Competibacteraceae bacterium]|nr:CDP-alcohol phosphatidyltransferase family protein [Candidatus Competibacteraceae bacterium]
MRTATPIAAVAPSPQWRRLATSALIDAAGALLLLAGSAAGLGALFRLPLPYVGQSLLAFAALLLALLPFLPQHLPLQRFGAANRVTLLRAAIAALAAGLIGRAPLTSGLLWSVAALAGLALALDGVDGYLARRDHLQSPFGARFDMEVDAFLILVLATLVYQTDKAGAWVLLSGLMRYGFIALGRALPQLNQPLPPSKRRQAICVIQSIALVAALTPLLVPPWSARLAAAALGALIASFAADVIWLARHSLSEENSA